MKISFNKPSTKQYRIFISLLLAGLWLFFIYHKLGFYFETNDDRYMVEILSGAMTGKCDSHIIFINYILSFPLSVLYNITTTIPWYGLMFILLQFLSYSIVIYSILKLCNNFLSSLVYTGLLFCAFFSTLYLSGLMQFTSTAALLAISGYVYIICTSAVESTLAKSHYFIFAGYELLAFLVRDNSMAMISIIGLSVLFVLKPQYNKLFPIIGCLLFIFIIGKLGNIVGYHGSDWNNYNRFNVARANIFDYKGTPEYDDVKHILDKYHVSESEYCAFCYYTILDSNISAECIEELEDYVYSANNTLSPQHQSSITHALASSFHNYSSTDLWSIGKLLILLYSCVFISMLLLKKWIYLPLIFATIISRTVVWTFLLYKGRMVHRVNIPVYLCEATILIIIFSIITKDIDFKKSILWKHAIIAFSVLLIIHSAYRTGIQQFRYVKEQNDMQKIFMEGLVEIHEYINSNTDKKFLLESFSMSSYRGSILDTRTYTPRNGLITGGWYTQSPPMNKALAHFFSPSDSSIAYIVVEGEDTRFSTNLNYLESLFGQSTLADSFTASHGGTYLVYYYE